jgi:hypothetical protein
MALNPVLSDKANPPEPKQRVTQFTAVADIYRSLEVPGGICPVTRLHRHLDNSVVPLRQHSVFPLVKSVLQKKLDT